MKCLTCSDYHQNYKNGEIVEMEALKMFSLQASKGWDYLWILHSFKFTFAIGLAVFLDVVMIQ